MNKRFSFMLVFSLSIAFPIFSEQSESSSTATEAPLLPWTTSYEQGMTQAQAKSLPIYLFFTGSSWCIWCQKMEKELHEQDAFRQKLVGKLVFVKVDLPAGAKPSEETRNLLSKYNVQGVPTVLILSSDGKELARFRYQKISPESYAELVSNTIP